jgi:hypothetical protein
LTYMYDNYFDDYEYFYLAGDDTHVIVENLRRYLYTVEQTHDVATEPLFMGNPFIWHNSKPELIYNDGGAGYVLNRVALKRLVLEAFPFCYPNVQVSMEDVFVAGCLKWIGINPQHTVDAQGRQRFLGTSPEDVGNYTGKGGLDHDFYGPVYAEWGRKYGWKVGADIVSKSIITFHTFRTVEEMKRHHAIIYDSCPVGTVLHAAVQKGRDTRDKSRLADIARR